MGWQRADSLRRDNQGRFDVEGGNTRQENGRLQINDHVFFQRQIGRHVDAVIMDPKLIVGYEDRIVANLQPELVSMGIRFREASPRWANFIGSFPTSIIKIEDHQARSSMKTSVLLPSLEV